MAKDFAKAIEIATETEDTAKVAKDTVHEVKPEPVHKVGPRPSHKATEIKPKTGKSACYRCSNENHQASQCCFKNSECKFVVVKDISQKYAGRNSLQMLELQRSQLTLYMKSKQ